jgi:hypothetical protein
MLRRDPKGFLWRQLRLQLEQLQLQHAEHLEPHQPDSDDHREISFRLPVLTNEFAQLKDQFQQDLQSNLGNTRAQLIWEKVSHEDLRNGYPMGDEERLVTFAANRNADGSVQHSLSFTNPNHTRAYQLNIPFDLQPNQALITTEDDGVRNAAVGVKLPSGGCEKDYFRSLDKALFLILATRFTCGSTTSATS